MTCRIEFLTREADIQKQILDYLGLRHFAWRNNTGAQVAHYKGKERFIQFGKVGSGDIFGVMRPTGTFFSIEVKRKGRNPTAHQIAFMRRVVESGGIAFVADRLEDVIEHGL